ncbi:hypothetical protein [Roseospira navarrensis]|uniref:DUF4105 domain-containing protein n=1 Tax=Roseospira navarrensis TaxID=140058 RepID=A0A7X1ZCX6_9PROT|nr:hypothetical protein [Roseospira navarrensis]MQX34920.1 hypothetical protein [Roseospira navarrensis]
MAASKIYWCARDLAGSPWGNHHFILVVQGEPKITSTMGVTWQKYAGTEFMTIAAFAIKKGGTNRLMLGYNEKSDVHAVKEVLNPAITKKQWSDFDLERHAVAPPNGKTKDAFVKDIIVKAELFKKNEAKKNLPYSLIDENCAAWVNSLFKACGVPKTTRIKAGEFSGFDWGEEDEIPASYFK